MAERSRGGADEEAGAGGRGTGSLFGRSMPRAPRRAHASAHARRDRRTAPSARAGQAAARGDRDGTRRLDGLLGAARHGKDDDRPRDRALHRSRVRPVFRRDGRRAAGSRDRRRSRGTSAARAAERFCSPTRSIASTRRSRTRFSRTSSRERSRSSARRRRIRRSRSTARCCRAFACSSSSRLAPTISAG